jgi:nucleoside-diphosphate-sugar epimerase
MAALPGSAIAGWFAAAQTAGIPLHPVQKESAMHTPSTSETTPVRTAAARPHILILGANGRLGLAAAQAFAAAGWQVTAPLRRAPVDDMPDTVQVLRVPLENTASLADAAAGASVVLHAVNPVYTRWNTDLLPLADAGMRLAERLGARLLLPGNVYNFGAGMPPLLREETPQQPSTRKGALRVTLETELALRAAQGRLQATVLRAGDFFGGGSGNWFDQAIVKSLRAGRLVYPGPTTLPHAWAYLPDLAQVFLALARRAPAAGAAFERFHFAGHTFTGDQLLDGIEQAAHSLGLRPANGWKRAGLPWGLIRVGGLVVPMWRELAEMAYLWQVPHALDGSALTAAVGPLPATSAPDALRASLYALGFGPRAGSLHRREAGI